MAQKDKVKELVGRGLDSYHTKALQQIDRINKKNKEQNHKISILSNELDNDYLTKTEEGSVVSLEHSKEGMVYLDELQGNTMVNYCTDGSKEMILNGDIDIEGTFVTTTEGVDGGLVDVMSEGNTMVNLASIQSIYENTNLTDYYVDGTLCETSLLKLNTAYTLIIEKEFLDGHNMNYKGFELGVGNSINVTNTHPTMSNGSYNMSYNTDKYETKIITISFADFKGYKYLTIRPCRRSTAPVEGEVGKYKVKIIFLEGDWTNKEIPSHFEGMKSVGQNNENAHKIEILSRNNGNLFDKNNITLGAYLNRKSGKVVQQDNSCYCNKFIEVKENDIIYTNNDSQVVALIVTYDENKNHIGEGYEGREPYTIQKGVKYIRISFYNRNTLLDSGKLWIGFSNDIIESKSYALNKKEILLNEPLRGIDNVKDKFVKIGGKWFIERKCKELVINLSTQGFSLQYWNGAYDTEDLYAFYLSNSDVFGTHPNNIKYQGSKKIICDKLPYVASAVSSKTQGIWSGLASTPPYIGFKLPKNLIDSCSGDSVLEKGKNYIKSLGDINFVVEYITPIYEPLEINPQFNTYNDITHISNNSIIPCNMKIQNTGYNAIIKPSTLYTVALDTNESGTIGINLGGAKVTTTNNVATITTPETLTDDSLRLYGKGIKGSKIRLLEGDKTNWIPSHFEGMKSSFEDKFDTTDNTYKMEILSNNKNLIDIERMLNKDNYLKGTYSSIKIPLKPNTKYYFKFNFKPNNIHRWIGIFSEPLGFNGTFKKTFVWNENIDEIKQGTFITDNSTEYYLSVFQPSVSYNDNNWYKELFTNVYENFIISQVDDNYMEGKSNKIQFSSVEPLRKWDRFVFKDGQLMIERGSGKIVYNGLENWSTYNNLNETMAFVIPRPIDSILSSSDTICDEFIYNSSQADIEHYYFGTNNMNIYINKNKISSKDLNGFKQWLQNNPTTIIYKLAEPTYEEIPFELQKIILEGYENGTLFFDTNIPPTSTVTYAGETPIVKSVKLNKTEVLNNTTDINDNILPYLMDMDYRVVVLQLEHGVQNMSMARLFGGTYEMLERDIKSNRLSKSEYANRLADYFNAKKLSGEEYLELEKMIYE